MQKEEVNFRGRNTSLVIFNRIIILTTLNTLKERLFGDKVYHYFCFDADEE